LSPEIVPDVPRGSEVDNVDKLVQALQNEVQRERVKIEASERKIGKILDAIQVLRSDAAPMEAQLPRRKKVHPKSTAHLVRKHTYEVLRQAGRPMSGREILEAMQARGVEFAAENPAKQVGRILWGAPEFTHLENGYWFADDPTHGAETMS